MHRGCRRLEIVVAEAAVIVTGLKVIPGAALLGKWVLHPRIYRRSTVVRFRCPRCNTLCQLDDLSSDRSLTCGSCGHTVQVAASTDAPPQARRSAAPGRAADRASDEEFADAADLPRARAKAGDDSKSTLADPVSMILRFSPIVIRVLALLRGGAWMISAIVLLSVLGTYGRDSARATSAVQEAAAAADACVSLIATYALTRAFHSITLAGETIFRKSA
jgi:hypothetical protein